jgi:hypothetical protein
VTVLASRTTASHAVSTEGQTSAPTPAGSLRQGGLRLGDLKLEVRGEDVIYDVHITARSRKTDLPLDQYVVHRMTIRNGKLVAWRIFLDRDDG